LVKLALHLYLQMLFHSGTQQFILFVILLPFYNYRWSKGGKMC